MKNKYRIPFFKIHHGKEEEAALLKVARSGWWSTGERTLEFEKKFSEYVGSKFSLLVDSGTTALYLALKALGITGQTFNVPSLTFTATAAEIIHSGNTIKFIDVNKSDLCVQGEYEGPLMKIHYGGNYCSARGSITVEDSAHLIEKNQCAGNENLVCFSLAYNKNITASEGGVVATNNKEIYKWLLKARFFGIHKLGLPNQTEHPDWPYEVEFLGSKGNNSEFHAALALVQLNKLAEVNARRQAIVDIYNEKFGYKWKGLHLYPIFVENRVEFLEKMADAGIQCSVHYTPLHWMKAYLNYPKANLTNTEWLGQRLVSLPLYPDLSETEIDLITGLTLQYAHMVKNS